MSWKMVDKPLKKGGLTLAMEYIVMTHPTHLLLML